VRFADSEKSQPILVDAYPDTILPSGVAYDDTYNNYSTVGYIAGMPAWSFYVVIAFSVIVAVVIILVSIFYCPCPNAKNKEEILVDGLETMVETTDDPVLVSPDDTSSADVINDVILTKKYDLPLIELKKRSKKNKENKKKQ
jgi:hypothetical protein